MRPTRLLLGIAAALVSALTPEAAEAATYHYVNWTSANASSGSASGTISLPDGSTVAVGFQAYNPDKSPGTFYFAQTNETGANYWNPSTPYISAEVENAPPGTDIIALVGGVNQTYVVTLSEAIKDPIMAIVSLGNPGLPTTYDFDSPFTIVSQGKGYWGGTATSLQQQQGDLLVGNEGHGTIRFVGTFSTFSWTVPTPENWHGFTFGIRTTEAIEPTVPEPTSMAALGAAAVALGATRRRGAPRA